MALQKMVDGKTIDCSPEEEAEILARWDYNDKNKDQIRKDERDHHYKTNFQMKAAYLSYKEIHPDVTFSEYLDYVESMNI